MLRRIGFVASLVLTAAACRERRAEEPGTLLKAYSAEELAKPSLTRPLGGMNLWGYCESIGYPTVGYKRGVIEGPQAAYENWVCQRGTDQLKPVDAKLVDMVAACRWQFSRQDVVARPEDPNHAWSWNCYPAPRR